MDKKALFTACLGIDAATVKDLSENRFATVIHRDGQDGTPEEVTTGEYHVWTDEEAASFGYRAGGRPTSDPAFQVYRIF